MALKQPTPEPTDPRLAEHRTTYCASRGGWYPARPDAPEPKEKK
jgi:hypothetical protein